MFIVLESEIILSQNSDSDISTQLLNSFKTLTFLSIIWREAPLNAPSNTNLEVTPHVVNVKFQSGGGIKTPIH